MSASTLMMALAAASFVSLNGCGGSGPATGQSKPKAGLVEEAKESLAQGQSTKVRGKKASPESNLSARERRALKQEGGLSK